MNSLQDMNFIDESAALFPVMARVNHACQPNADFVCRPQMGKNKSQTFYISIFFQDLNIKLDVYAYSIKLVHKEIKIVAVIIQGISGKGTA